MSDPEPRLMSGRQAAAYCGITPATWSKWVATGIMPPPLPSTRRWDRKAIDLALDRASGISAQSTGAESQEMTLAEWKAQREAEREWERQYDARKARRPR